MYFVAEIFVQCEMITGHDEDIPVCHSHSHHPTFGFGWLADTWAR